MNSTTLKLLCRIVESPHEADKWRGALEDHLMKHFQIDDTTHRESQRIMMTEVRKVLGESK